MKKVFKVFLLTLFAMGTICLPMVDCTILTDIPTMYSHCQISEDNNMKSIDFITDHVINFESIFDEHFHDENQKPHRPMQTNHEQFSYTYIITEFIFTVKQVTSYQEKLALPHENYLITNYFSKIFRPPIG